MKGFRKKYPMVQPAETGSPADFIRELRTNQNPLAEDIKRIYQTFQKIFLNKLNTQHENCFHILVRDGNVQMLTLFNILVEDESLSPEKIRELAYSRDIEQNTPILLAVKAQSNVFYIQCIIKAFVSLLGWNILSDPEILFEAIDKENENEALLLFLCVNHTHLLREKDRNSNTGLHLSILNNKYTAFNILVMNTESKYVNLENANGETPLHLAVYEFLENEETNDRNIKLLLEAGAERKIKDNEGRIPSDLNQNNRLPFAMFVIFRQENPNVLTAFCKPRKVPFKSKYELSLFFLGFLLIKTLMVLLLLVPYIDLLEGIGCLVIMTLSLFFYYLLFFQKVEPKKYETTEEDKTFESLEKKIELQNERIFNSEPYNEFCFKCLGEKHKGIEHCYHCDRCVIEYDHHCSFLKVCIAKGNINYFRIFILFCLVDFIYHFVIATLQIFNSDFSCKKGLYEEPCFHSYLMEFFWGLMLFECFVATLLIAPTCFESTAESLEKRRNYSSMTSQTSSEVSLLERNDIEIRS